MSLLVTAKNKKLTICHFTNVFSLILSYETFRFFYLDLNCFSLTLNWLYGQRIYWMIKNPATFVGISAMRANFCIKFYTTVKQKNTHFTTNFC